jgi:hypothetical protein
MVTHQIHGLWSEAMTMRHGLFQAPISFLLGKVASQLAAKIFKAFNDAGEHSLGGCVKIKFGEFAADIHKGAVQAVVLSLEMFEVSAAMIYAVHGCLLSN